MSRRLPYRAMTASGNVFEFEFPLHDDTGSAVHVDNLLSALLAKLDHELKQLGAVSNGDVLQALAMAIAVRARMLPGSDAMVDALARELVDTALSAGASPATGNLPDDTPRDVH